MNSANKRYRSFIGDSIESLVYVETRNAQGTEIDSWYCHRHFVRGCYLRGRGSVWTLCPGDKTLNKIGTSPASGSDILPRPHSSNSLAS